MNKRERARRLLVLASCCLMAASSVGIFTNSVGVFNTKVSADLGVGRGAFALHATICSLVMGFLCPVAARLMKRFPYRPLMIAGSALASGATALMALANSVWAFYVLGSLRGIGMTTFSLTALISPAHQHRIYPSARPPRGHIIFCLDPSSLVTVVP